MSRRRSRDDAPDGTSRRLELYWPNLDRSTPRPRLSNHEHSGMPPTTSNNLVTTTRSLLPLYTTSTSRRRTYSVAPTSPTPRPSSCVVSLPTQSDKTSARSSESPAAVASYIRAKPDPACLKFDARTSRRDRRNVSCANPLRIRIWLWRIRTGGPGCRQNEEAYA